MTSGGQLVPARPLAGLKVLEFGHRIGPTAGLLRAEPGGFEIEAVGERHVIVAAV